MNRDEKILKINAYKKLIETKRLPRIETDTADGVQTVENEIHAEFTLWAEGQLSALLGEPQTGSESTFTEQETSLLKAFAGTLANRITSKEATKEKPSTVQSMPVRETPRSVKKGTALVEEQEVRDGEPLGQRLRKAKPNQDVTSYLDDLDRQGPNF